MPTVHGLEFAYALHDLPPGRWGFRRWRWEVSHGTSLLAAGWRVSRRQAERAVRDHAVAHAYRLFGLRPPATIPDVPLPAASSAAVEVGPIRLTLIPWPVLHEQRAAAVG